MSIICNHFSEENMKRSLSRKILALSILLLILISALASCAAPCVHADEDKDYICDKCEGDLERTACLSHYDKECDAKCDICQRIVLIEHIDADADGKCDKCKGCTAHIDADCDAGCDKCSATVKVAHLDTDADGKCDKCKACTLHIDTNCDAKCDNCPATVEIMHIDNNSDNKCDKCRACFLHSDIDCDGKCDLCYARVDVVHRDTDDDGVCNKCHRCTRGHADNNCDGVCDKDGATTEILHLDLTGDGVCDKCHRCTEGHTDNNCDGVCDKDGATVAITHEDKDKNNVCDKCEHAICAHEYGEDDMCTICGNKLEKISYTIRKSASVSRGKTLYPSHKIEYNSTTYRGENVTFTFTIKNTGNVVLRAVLSDTLSEGVRLVSGCDIVDGGRLSWAVELAEGEEREISYTVEVTATESGVISGKGAEMLGEAIAGDDLYMAPTFNDIDKEYIDKAIKILLPSTYSGLDFAKHAYTVAFTNAAAITALLTTPDEALTEALSDTEVSAMVAPGLYGGSAISENISSIKGERLAGITEADLVAGDLILVRTAGTTRIYIVANDAIYDITTAEKTVSSPLASLASQEAFVVLRPSMTMSAFTPSNPDETPEVLNAYQEALIKTAESYLLRGEALQYDDTRFGFDSSNEFRWQIDIKSPEDFTNDEWGYLNCAAFTYEVYRTGLGYTLPSSMYTTANLTKYSDGLGMRAFYFKNETPGEYTEEFKLLKERELMETLEAGDILVVRRKNSSGHAMLYVGNGRLIHSGGGNYSKTSSGVGYEVYEPTIRCHKVSDYVFNDSSVGGNPFRGADEYSDNYVTEILLVRPLNVFKGEIPEVSTQRVNGMSDIVVEKTSSHPSSTTVNIGGEITYYFTLTSYANEAMTIGIRDKAPAGTTYLSGAENVNDGTLSWQITLAPGETVTLSYAVKVNEDTKDGALIFGTDAIVGGIPVKCPGIYVKRTLTESEQERLLEAIEEIRKENTTLIGLEIVNEAYKRTLGIDYDIFKTTDADEVMAGEDGVFVASTHKFSSKYCTEINTDESAYYRSMMADGLYGGMRVYSANLKNDRTRLVREENLVIGDVLVGRTSSAIRVFIYTGNSTWIILHDADGDGRGDFTAPSSFATICENILYFGRDFAVLRPSFVVE